jgi:hypothetical protein
MHQMLHSITSTVYDSCHCLELLQSDWPGYFRSHLIPDFPASNTSHLTADRSCW